MVSTERPTEHLDAIIIGGGFSGIYLLHELRKRGFTARIYEAADGLGGVWYANDYPGCRTDIEIPFYQLDIEEVGVTGIGRKDFRLSRNCRTTSDTSSRSSKLAKTPALGCEWIQQSTTLILMNGS
jgi:hypothetical protein